MNRNPYPSGSNIGAPWLDDDDDDSKWTKWSFDEINKCQRCLNATEVDESGLCESCFIPEELTELDYLDE